MDIRQITERKIIYKRRVGAYGPENNHLMEHFKLWLKTNDLFKSDSVILAIPRDNPQTTEPQNCRYDVALVVDSFDAIKSLSIAKSALAAGKYAVFTVEHNEKAIAETMQNMFLKIESSGYAFNPQQPIIERYAVNMIENNQCEICVPIL